MADEEDEPRFVRQSLDAQTEPVEHVSPARATDDSSIAIATGVVIVLMVVGFMVVKAMNADAPPLTETQMAIRMCEQFVRKNLVAPWSASFASENADPEKVRALERKPEERPVYEVKGQVDADNVFGARIRGRYNCWLKRSHPDEDMWELLYLVPTEPSQFSNERGGWSGW